MKDIINDLKKFGAWAIQLEMAINFVSSKDDINEEDVMYSKSNNKEIMMNMLMKL